MHYFPDDPKQWQEVNLASLFLGQGGIWGDLPKVSHEGIGFVQSTLARYKQVREDIAERPDRDGPCLRQPGNPREDLSDNGRGAVVLFATTAGSYRYVTTHTVAADFRASERVQMSRDSSGRAVIDATFEKPGAKKSCCSELRNSSDGRTGGPLRGTK